MKGILQTMGVLSCMLVLSSCNEVPPEYYANVGDPERQISTATETVTVALTSEGSLNELSDVLAQDEPAKVTLNCTKGSKLCRRAEGILEKHNIVAEKTTVGTGETKSVVLVYEKIMARDCDSRYVDNSSNPYNLEPQNMGCAVRANMVQHVTDKRQFTKPGLLSLMDGERAAKTYDSYANPPAASSSGGSGASGSSLIGSGSTGSGSQ